MHPSQLIARVSRRLSPSRALGTTTIEVVIACILLSAALVSIGTLQTQVARAQKSLNQRAQLRVAILNARALIGSWSPSQISSERIQAIPIEPLDQAWPEALRWKARVTPATEPWRGMSIFLDLIWEEAGQVHSTGGLTFWVHEPLEAARDLSRAPASQEAEQP